MSTSFLQLFDTLRNYPIVVLATTCVTSVFMSTALGVLSRKQIWIKVKIKSAEGSELMIKESELCVPDIFKSRRCMCDGNY